MVALTMHRQDTTFLSFCQDPEEHFCRLSLLLPTAFRILQRMHTDHTAETREDPLSASGMLAGILYRPG
ncbi:MAG: hypothetical protein WB626_10270, partial [Bacteroidota bacterium]